MAHPLTLWALIGGEVHVGHTHVPETLGSPCAGPDLCLCFYADQEGTDAYSQADMKYKRLLTVVVSSALSPGLTCYCACAYLIGHVWFVICQGRAGR